MALLDRILRAGEGKKVKALASLVPWVAQHCMLDGFLKCVPVKERHWSLLCPHI